MVIETESRHSNTFQFKGVKDCRFESLQYFQSQRSSPCTFLWQSKLEEKLYRYVSTYAERKFRH